MELPLRCAGSCDFLTGFLTSAGLSLKSVVSENPCSTTLTLDIGDANSFGRPYVRPHCHFLMRSRPLYTSECRPMLRVWLLPTMVSSRMSLPHPEQHITSGS